MAACDYIDGNKKEWKELYQFIEKTNPDFIKYMISEPKNESYEGRICYIPSMQEWLLRNCPIEWVQNRLGGKFDLQRMLCGKAHHEEQDQDQYEFHFD